LEHRLDKAGVGGSRPPRPTITPKSGGLAQLGEHLLCKQGVVGSIPSSSTKHHSTPKRLDRAVHCVPGFFVVDAASAASIGCSLTIHRVESALLTETASWRTVPSTTF